MGYLNNTSVTVDAILTLKGREYLSEGNDSFKITQFALGDDEVDYSLWNTDHPLGSDYYGIDIENLPITEAVPDETQALKSKLITLPKDSTKVPIITVGESSITLQSAGDSSIISPNTSNLQGGNGNLGYTVILSDSTVADLQVSRQVTAATAPAPQRLSRNADAQSIAQVGFEFRVVAKRQVISDKTATLTIIGNETGGSVTVNLTAKKETTA